MTPLVIVSGPPAAGKTTLATMLSRALALPVLSKDSVKEAMMDHLGGAPTVGKAAFAVQVAVARELLTSGVGVILEGAFFGKQADFIDLAGLGDAVVLQLECQLRVLEQRYIDRQSSRHPLHRGLEALPELRERVHNGAYDLPDLGRPVLRIDTTDGLTPSEAEIVHWLREQLGGGNRQRQTAPGSDPTRTEPGERIDLRAAWDQQSEAWPRWARAPEHDSYWRFGRAAFFELLPAPGRLTLDVGCGEGRVSRDLVTLGHQVVAIDASRAMVTKAVEAAPGLPALVADAAALPFIDGCCDLIIAYMSLQDVDDMLSAIHEMARTLGHGGRLCMAVVHPINSAGRFESLDPNASFVIKGSYLDSHHYVDKIERGGLGMTFSSVHRPLQAYVHALEEAGFVVESLREVPVGKTSSDDPRHKRWRRLPLFLYVRAVKAYGRQLQ